MLRAGTVSVSILVGIIWLQQSLRFIDLIVNRGLNVGEFVLLTILLIPNVLIVILPLAYFFGLCSSLKRLRDDNEVDAMFASGISRLQLLKPALRVALVVTALGYVNAFWALPAGKTYFKDIQHDLRQNRTVQLLEEGTFNQVTDTLMVYVRQRDIDGNLTGLLVHDTSSPSRPVTWLAQQGRVFVSPQSNISLELAGGSRQEVSENNLNILQFEKHTIDLSRQVETGEVRYRDADERFINELLFFTPPTENDVLKFKAELQRRLLWPLTPIPLAMIAIALMLHPIKNRKGITLPLVATVILGIMYQILLMIAATHAEEGNFTALYGQWLLPLSVCITLYFYLRGKAGGRA
jgi:lipopolysaccharide export system permease protein